MGNTSTKRKKLIENELWKRKILRERHLQALAETLPQTAEYLGTSALGLSKQEVEEIIRTNCKETELMASAPSGPDSAGDSITEQKKIFILLLNWRKQNREPTAEALHKLLWKAGYKENAYMFVLKHGFYNPKIMEVEFHNNQNTTGNRLPRPALRETKRLAHSFSSMNVFADELSADNNSNNNTNTRSDVKRRKAVSFDLGDNENPLAYEDMEMIEIADVSTQTDVTYRLSEPRTEKPKSHDASNSEQPDASRGKFSRTISRNHEVTVTVFDPTKEGKEKEK